MAKGGSHEQHVKASEQSHKNQDDKERRGRQQAERGHEGQQHCGGSGNFAEDRERASEAGRKGGQS